MVATTRLDSAYSRYEDRVCEKESMDMELWKVDSLVRTVVEVVVVELNSVRRPTLVTWHIIPSGMRDMVMGTQGRAKRSWERSVGM
jgi:hypothetical protein